MPTKRLVDEDGNVVGESQLLEEDSEEDEGKGKETRDPPFPRPSVPPPRWCTTPHSIAAAVREDLRRQRQRQRHRNGLTGTSDDPPIDVVAVVLSVDLNVSEKTADILVADPTLPSNGCAKVSYRGSSAVVSRLLDAERLSGGDVVRFNRLAVRRVVRGSGDDVKEWWSSTSLKDDRSAGEGSSAAEERGSNDPSARMDPSKSLVCKGGKTETTSVATPVTTRPSANRLRTILCEFHQCWKDPEAGQPFAKLSEKAPSSSSSPSSMLPFQAEVLDANRLPPNYATPPALVSQLVDWFRCQAAQMPMLQSPCVTMTPCKKRRLRDIAVPNLVSDVIVRVLSCDSGVVICSGGNRKRKRYSAVQTQSVYAMISDGSKDEDMMALHNCSHLKASLVQATKERSQIMLTRALSRSVSSSSSTDREIILVPTVESAVVVIGKGDFNCTRGGDASQRYSPTQATQLSLTAGYHEKRSAAPDLAETRKVLSKLVAVFVDDMGVSLAEGTFSNPRDLRNVLVDANYHSGAGSGVRSRVSYRKATLTLDSTSLPDSFIVKADEAAMQMLCGSVPAEDLLRNEIILGHVCNLLCGLCDCAVPLRWTLKRGRGCKTWSVVDVALLSI